MEWNEIVEKVKPHIVKIETPAGSGTGFLCFYSQDRRYCGIATALHVVSYANDWNQPIKILQLPSFEQIYLEGYKRVIYPDWKTDSAIILFEKPEKPVLPENPIPFRPIDKILDIGEKVGWIGYPYLEPYKLCFFSGSISARREDRNAYLIDGVSINGVSGGPVILSNDKNEVEIVGIISSYMANLATGGTLPGLSIAQDVSHFQNTVQTFRSIDDARKKQEEIKMKEEKEKIEKGISQPPEIETKLSSKGNG